MPAEYMPAFYCVTFSPCGQRKFLKRFEHLPFESCFR